MHIIKPAQDELGSDKVQSDDLFGGEVCEIQRDLLPALMCLTAKKLARKYYFKSGPESALYLPFL